MCTAGASWDSLHVFDWEAQVPNNSTVDVIRGVEVGLTKDTNGARLLLIRFVDTGLECVQPSGGAWYNWKQDQPSVWALALRATTIRDIEKIILANPADQETLQMIHREPWTDGSTWFCEAKWLMEDNQLTGVKIELKASQDSVSQVHEIRFMTKGHYFRKVSIKDVSPDTGDQVAVAYLEAMRANPLPPEVKQERPSAAGSAAEPTPLFPTEKAPIRTDYIAEGDSTFELEIDGEGGSTSMSQGYCNRENLIQSLVSGKITIRNPTEQDGYIKRVYTQVVLSTDGVFLDCNDTKDSKGASIGNFNGTYVLEGQKLSEVAWQSTDTSYSLPAKSIHHICVKAACTLANTKAYQGRPMNMRLHHKFPQPMTVKAVFVDDQDRTKTICWDYADDPPEHMHSVDSYKDLVANEKEMKRLGNNRGVGNDYVCDLWLHLDDPETRKRTFVVVTHAKESPKEWYIRAAETDGTFPSSYMTIKPSTFRRMVYEAKKKGSTNEIDKSKEWSRSKSCNLKLLLDLDKGIAYGLTASIGIGELSVSKSIYLDQATVADTGR